MNANLLIDAFVNALVLKKTGCLRLMVGEKSILPAVKMVFCNLKCAANYPPPIYSQISLFYVRFCLFSAFVPEVRAANSWK